MNNLIVCRCEEVMMGDIQYTAAKHQCSAREIKLRTRAGMGYCGGRICRPLINAAIEEVTGEKPSNNIPLKVQSPVRPMSLSELGGSEDD